MFLDYYKLREMPFGVIPDPRYLYLSLTHREALASLIYGVEMNRGFMALVARPGMGKTTLLFQLMERLRGRARTVFLFQTQCDSREFLRYLLHDAGVSPSHDFVEMHQQLNDLLLRRAAEGELVLIIDEAQNLSPSVLETVRLLTDFETPRHKLLQVVLAGQPQLMKVLASPSMEQLWQRIAVFSALKPLGQQEVADYVRHRLEIAGYSGAPLFTAEALGLVAHASEGIPRKINTICFDALSLGFALKHRKIGRDLVEEAIADHELHSEPERPETPTSDPIRPSTPIPDSALFAPPLQTTARRPFALTAAVLLLATLLSLGWHFRTEMTGWLAYPQTAANRVPPTSVAPSPPMIADAQPTNAAPEVSAPTAEVQEIVVERGQTLRQICLKHFGRNDAEVLRGVQTLNPELHDLNHVEIGQRLRLPALVTPQLGEGAASNNSGAVPVAVGRRP